MAKITLNVPNGTIITVGDISFCVSDNSNSNDFREPIGENGEKVRIISVEPDDSLTSSHSSFVEELGLSEKYFSDRSIESDAVARKIMEDGYIPNSHLFRRWIAAQTFSLLSDPNGWDCACRKRYTSDYQFSMLKKELETLEDMEISSSCDFHERKMFFDANVLCKILCAYKNQLERYLRQEKKNKSDGIVVKRKFVRFSDIEKELIVPVDKCIKYLSTEKNSLSFVELNALYKKFLREAYIKLPEKTPLIEAWKDAFKGAGAYYTLQNMIRFHKVNLDSCSTLRESEELLYEKLVEYKSDGCIYRLMNELVDTISINDFSLKSSIAAGNSAPDTCSSLALKYMK